MFKASLFFTITITSMCLCLQHRATTRKVTLGDMLYGLSTWEYETVNENNIKGTWRGKNSYIQFRPFVSDRWNGRFDGGYNAARNWQNNKKPNKNGYTKDMKGTKMELVTETPEQAGRNPDAQHRVHPKPFNSENSSINNEEIPNVSGYTKDMEGTKMELVTETPEQADRNPDAQHIVHPKPLNSGSLSFNNEEIPNVSGYTKDMEGTKMELVTETPEQAGRNPDAQHRVHPTPLISGSSSFNNEEIPNVSGYTKDMEGTKMELVTETPEQVGRNPDAQHIVHSKAFKREPRTANQ